MKIRVNYIIRQVFLAAFVSLSLSACNLRRDEILVSPPITFPLSQSYIGFGVTNVSYTRLSAGIEDNSPSPGYLRQGSVVRVIERRMVNNEEKTEAWVLVELIEGTVKGWLKESLLDIYGNESQAVTAAKSIRNEE
jgi:hypothetical protein